MALASGGEGNLSASAMLMLGTGGEPAWQTAGPRVAGGSGHGHGATHCGLRSGLTHCRPFVPRTVTMVCRVPPKAMSLGSTPDFHSSFFWGGLTGR